jgi:hypothetical protein
MFVGVKLDGRLGNQMFQYAYLLAQGHKTLKFHFIDQVYQNFDLIKYFDLKSYNGTLNSIICKSLRTLRLIEKTPKAKSNNVLVKYHVGYFQNFELFDKVKLNQEFKIKKTYRDEFQEKFGYLIGINSIAIHVRKTDYTTFGGTRDISVSLEYYQKAFSQIKGFNEKEKVFVTDDISWVKQNFSNLNKSHFISDTEINDFQILMNCPICIIANSTFSWWAAMLNEQPNKIVFAPKYWMGYHEKKEIPEQILNKLNWKIIHHSE